MSCVFPCSARKKFLQISYIWGAKSDCNHIHSKKLCQVWLHGKCLTIELLGSLAERVMAPNTRLASYFVKFTGHCGDEMYWNMTLRRKPACYWQNLRMVDRKMMNIRLDYLFSSPTTLLKPYSELYFQGNIYFISTWHYRNKLSLVWLWFLGNTDECPLPYYFEKKAHCHFFNPYVLSATNYFIAFDTMYFV